MAFALALGTALTFPKTGGLGASLANSVDIDGMTFAVLPDEDRKRYNVTASNFPEVGSYRMEGRPGDNNGAGDENKIRVGLDGFPETFPNQRTKINENTFFVYPQSGCLATATGEWWHIFELHTKFNVGDGINSTGPLHITSQWSDGLSQNRLRIWRRYLVEDPIVDEDSFAESVIYDTGSFSHGHKYRFRVQWREHPTLGVVKVWLSVDDAAETQIVNYIGQFGYGTREIYPQYRAYCTERPRIVAYYGDIEFAEYDLPAVADETFIDPASWTLAGTALGTTSVTGGVLNIASTGSGGDAATGFYARAALNIGGNKLPEGNWRISYEIKTRTTGSISAAAGPNTDLYNSSQKESSAQFAVGVHTWDVTVPSGGAYIGLIGRGSAAVNMTVDNFTATQLP